MSAQHLRLAVCSVVAASLSLLVVVGNAQTAAPQAAGKANAHQGHSMDMQQSMDKMSRQMSETPMSGDVDRDFAVMMRIHHEGAIDMARAQLASGKDAQMRKLAQEIIAAQKKEIELIDRWLQKRDKR